MPFRPRVPLTLETFKSLRTTSVIGPSGPYENYSGACQETGPIPFPTRSIWWSDHMKTTKLTELIIVRNAQRMPITETLVVYAADGVTPVSTFSDTITYVNNIFETSRTRTQT